MRIHEITAGNRVLMSLHDFGYEASLNSLESALYIKQQLKKLESTSLYQGAVKQLIEPIYPLAQFILTMHWEEPDTDIDHLKSLANQILSH
jgi:hypothetical protein